MPWDWKGSRTSSTTFSSRETWTVNTVHGTPESITPTPDSSSLARPNEFEVASPNEPIHCSTQGHVDPNVTILKNWTFPLRCHMAQELCSNHYPVITETYLTLTTPSPSKMNRKHNWNLNRKLNPSIENVNDLEEEVCSTTWQIQETLKKSELKPKFPEAEALVDKIKERNRISEDFQRTRYPPIKEAHRRSSRET
ncbi:hypothetical protein AMK59_2199 [Oryctes borbonicus]|uniref:Uncharacterized protein n=1 Tax=Oryctes borbonicus TaxID=1629725 RepID=A0A0T6BCS1_9SCAR|nr:hypothetical protein AMK59_2199 [Oryctes borbonicus]